MERRGENQVNYHIAKLDNSKLYVTLVLPLIYLEEWKAKKQFMPNTHPSLLFSVKLWFMLTFGLFK
jgi:hypothetical protein